MLLQRFYLKFRPKQFTPFKVPIPSNERICGSSHCWLANWIPQGGIVTLINPFRNRVSIPLPPIYESLYINKLVRYNECNVHKVILSSNLQLSHTIMLL